MSQDRLSAHRMMWISIMCKTHICTLTHTETLWPLVSSDIRDAFCRSVYVCARLHVLNLGSSTHNPMLSGKKKQDPQNPLNPSPPSLSPPPPSLISHPFASPSLCRSISPSLPLLSHLSNNGGMEALIERADLSWMRWVCPPNGPWGNRDWLPDQILPKFKTAIIPN